MEGSKLGRIRALARVGMMPLVIAGATPMHIGHGQTAIKQRLPRWLMWIFSRYEHIIMRSIDFLAGRDWIYANDAVRRVVMGLSALIMNTVNGEVLSLAEAREMVANACDEGILVAAGTCPCRRARNIISDTKPNNTDVVFGKWAAEYLQNYPGLYQVVGRQEVLDMVDEFDRHGYLHQVYGFFSSEGAAFVLCNCAPDICIPLQAQKRRGFQAFRKGRGIARVDQDLCLGLEECGACLERCPFDARLAAGPKGEVDLDACFGCGLCVSTCRGSATKLERKPGARLVYARRLVE